jgi:mRNA-degrading endonuclease toxin of MazEF toxin-antitoxin module
VTSRRQRAFLAGYLPQMAGLYFNGVQLLAQVSRAATGRLAAQVGEERERVVGHRDEALARVDESEVQLAALGGEPVERPEDAEAYPAWTEAVFEAVQGAVEPGSPEAVSHLLGYVLGEAVATLDVIAIVSRLRELDAENLYLRVQGESLERDRATVERRLGKLTAHPALPEGAQVATALAAHAVAEGAPSESHRARATRATAAVQTVAEQAAVARSAL